MKDWIFMLNSGDLLKMEPFGGKIENCENFPLLTLFAALIFLCLLCAFLSFGITPVCLLAPC